jgi:hypothetical protein
LAIIPQLNYGNSSPLILGYSRGTRFKSILEKLFYPRLFGKPNAKVLYYLSLLPPNHFTTGGQLLKWLAALQIPNKNYQCAHYYFIFATKPKCFPKPPHLLTILKIEKDFIHIHNQYQSSATYKSFFSYNWVLRKILENYQLDYYQQFVKPIKCKRRLQKYAKMYLNIMTSNNDFAALGNSQNCQKEPVSPLGDAIESRQLLLSFSNLSARIRHYTGVPS